MPEIASLTCAEVGFVENSRLIQPKRAFLQRRRPPCRQRRRRRTKTFALVFVVAVDTALRCSANEH